MKRVGGRQVSLATKKAGGKMRGAHVGFLVLFNIYYLNAITKNLNQFLYNGSITFDGY